jgi:predicted aspartyl protease
MAATAFKLGAGAPGMGRIITSVSIESVSETKQSIRCDAMVDTGAAHLVLPAAWKDRLGPLELVGTVDVEMADQSIVKAEVFGPVKIQVEGFRPVFNEVLFLDMQPENGIYEPLLGYLVLEQCQAAVDMVGHRLVHVKHLDLK